MSYLFHSETVEVSGIECLLEYFHDEDSDAPWENDEGCGTVRKAHDAHAERCSDKKPGERPLNQAGRNEYQFYYDWQEAMKIAKRDGWNAKPLDAPNRALRAVQSDFDYLQGYVNNDWHYAGVVCTVLDADGEKTDVSDSCWGFETLNDYHETEGKAMAQSLIEGHLQAKREAWRKALHEARERKYWNSRDIETVGA